MAESPYEASGTGVLRPKARILRTLGDELISSETVALIELVKNSYDADATRVLVRFHGIPENGKGRIEVIDNGHGMSLQTIQTAWMEPATLFRKRQHRSKRLKRRVLGEKGIGRFAASRLAEFLEVVTRRAGTNSEVRIFFDWSQFDDEQKYLDEVEVLWEEVASEEICLGGAIQALWERDNIPDPCEPTHGTILRMEGLRADWTKSEFESLRTSLSRLLSPSFGQDQVTRNDEFRIYLELPVPFDHLSGIVEPPESLRNPHYAIKGDVDENSHYKLAITLRGRKHSQRIVGRFFPDDRTPQCGPFHIELRVWDRGRDDLAELVNLYGSTLKDVRADLDRVAGINIYRDGFRVLPYGELRNDWMRLDLRRVQNPTLRLSNNQLVGYVLISADANPQLRDQSNREGIIEGPALNDLRELVEMVLAELEKRRYNLRRQQDEGQPTTRPGGLFRDFDLAPVRDLIGERYSDDAELVTLLEEKDKDLGRRVDEVQEVLARYRRLATLGQLIDIVLHDGRAPLTKIGNETLLGLRDIERAGIDNDRLVQRLGGRLGTIDIQSDVLATVFRRIEPFGGRKRGRPTRVRLEQVIADAFSVLDTEIAEVGAQVNLPITDTQTTVDQAEIQEVVINLLQNSLYWLRQVPKENRKIAVSTHKIADEVQILFSDDGPGVECEFRDRIFEPYFSSKPNGIGLGLTIAGEIVNEYYAGDLELVEGGSLSGTTFRITLRKRV